MKREALKLALEAMEYMAKIRDCQREAGYPLSDADKGLQKAITAIKEALAQPEQEPDAYQSGFYDGKKAARARCIELVLSGTGEPVQTRTLEILQEERKRIAKLIEEDGKP